MIYLILSILAALACIGAGGLIYRNNAERIERVGNNLRAAGLNTWRAAVQLWHALLTLLFIR